MNPPPIRGIKNMLVNNILHKGPYIVIKTVKGVFHVIISVISISIIIINYGLIFLYYEAVFYYIQLTWLFPKNDDISILFNIIPVIILVYIYTLWLLYAKRRGRIIIILLSAIVALPVQFLLYLFRDNYMLWEGFFNRWWWSAARLYYFFDYLSILVHSIIIYYLPPFFKTRNKSIVYAIAAIVAIFAVWSILTYHACLDNFGDFMTGSYD